MLEECNYDAGRTMDTYKPLFLSAFTGDLFPFYPDIPGFLNSNIVKTNIVQHIRMIHNHYNNAIKFWNLSIQNSSSGAPVDIPVMCYEEYPDIVFTPSNQHFFKFEVEEMVFHMRRILDSLVQLTFLMTNQQKFLSEKKIEIDSIGHLLTIRNPKNDLELILIGDNINYRSDKTNFIKTINQLFNSFKHCLLHDESYMLFCKEYPTVCTYFIKNDFNKKVVYHNHNLHHIMMGFQDCVTRILENQKKYFELQRN